MSCFQSHMYLLCRMLFLLVFFVFGLFVGLKAQTLGSFQAQILGPFEPIFVGQYMPTVHGLLSSRPSDHNLVSFFSRRPHARFAPVSFLGKPTCMASMHAISSPAGQMSDQHGHLLLFHAHPVTSTRTRPVCCHPSVDVTTPAPSLLTLRTDNPAFSLASYSRVQAHARCHAACQHSRFAPSPCYSLVSDFLPCPIRDQPSGHLSHHQLLHATTPPALHVFTCCPYQPLLAVT